LETHGSDIPQVTLLLSCTTGGAIMGMLDSENTTVTKIAAFSTVVGISVIAIPQVCRGHEGDFFSLMAAAFIAGVVYHFTSSYLADINLFPLSSIKK
jgi:hypothetical protein